MHRHEGRDGGVIRSLAWSPLRVSRRLAPLVGSPLCIAFDSVGAARITRARIAAERIIARSVSDGRRECVCRGARPYAERSNARNPNAKVDGSNPTTSITSGRRGGRTRARGEHTHARDIDGMHPCVRIWMRCMRRSEGGDDVMRRMRE
jgi:hypothetical protein